MTIIRQINDETRVCGHGEKAALYVVFVRMPKCTRSTWKYSLIVQLILFNNIKRWRRIEETMSVVPGTYGDMKRLWRSRIKWCWSWGGPTWMEDTKLLCCCLKIISWRRQRRWLLFLWWDSHTTATTMSRWRMRVLRSSNAGLKCCLLR